MIAVDGSFDQPASEAPPAVRLARDISARGALLAIERSCIDELKLNASTLEQARSAEALHRMRVALRRWRTALDALGKAATPEEAAAAVELKWIAGELDDARDLDVFAHGQGARRTRGGARPRGAAAFAKALAKARSGAYDRAAQALGSDRWRRFIWDATRRAAGPGWIDDDGPRARTLAATALRRRARRVTSDGKRLRKLDPHARHRLRIQTKKARYTAELFADLFDHPRRRRRFVEALRTLQGALGDLNDIHVGQGLAERLVREAAAPGAAIANRFAGDETERVEGLLRKARKAYDRFVRVEAFW